MRWACLDGALGDAAAVRGNAREHRELLMIASGHDVHDRGADTSVKEPRRDPPTIADESHTSGLRPACQTQSHAAYPAPRVACGGCVAERDLKLSAVPSGQGLSSIDLDLTTGCNLRCRYCFKEKHDEHMDERVAFDTIVWGLHAAGQQKRITFNLMGGEPLLRYELLKKLVPFAKRRGRYHGKNVHFGATTNCTLVTDDLIAFWKKWDMGFHTSVDGIPEVQDWNRPTAAGGASSPLVERAVPGILAYRPKTTARCTVAPQTCAHAWDNYRYFRSLGYTDIAMVPANPPEWDAESIRVYEDQWRRIANTYMEELRAGTWIRVKGFDEVARFCKSAPRNKTGPEFCGAGRGLLLVDVSGGLWPCHRFNTEFNEPWRLGSIYEGFDESVLSRLNEGRAPAAAWPTACNECAAKPICSGGCFAENICSTGSPFVRHPNACEMTRVWMRIGKEVHDTMYAEQNRPFMEHYYRKSENERGKRDPNAITGGISAATSRDRS